MQSIAWTMYNYCKAVHPNPSSTVHDTLFARSLDAKSIALRIARHCVGHRWCTCWRMESFWNVVPSTWFQFPHSLLCTCIRHVPMFAYWFLCPNQYYMQFNWMHAKSNFAFYLPVKFSRISWINKCQPGVNSLLLCVYFEMSWSRNIE